MQPDTTTEDTAIFELSFRERARFRPFHLVAPGFVQTFMPDVGGTAELATNQESPPAPFAAVEVEVAGPGGVVAAGLAAGQATGNVHLLATYDGKRRRVALQVHAGGRTQVLRRRTVDVPEAFTLGFVVCENQATVLVRGDGPWRPVLTERTKVAARLDLRDPRTLHGLRYAWGARPGSGQEVRLGEVRAGPFGMTGLRDPHLVQHVDGTPYVRDGLAYLTFTCAGLGFFQQAHWGVFTLDLDDPTRLEQVAQLYTRRDGLVLGDHAGQIVRDDEQDRWIVANSSWGDFDFRGVHVRHATTDADVLSGVHVLETTPLDLPTKVSAWDPGVTRVDGAWHVSFVESPSQRPFRFHPALAAGPAGASWPEGLGLVGAARRMRACEGPVLARVDGAWWLLASDSRSRSYPVFDLAMRRVGRLDAPYPTNVPHPQLVPRPAGGWLMVTFDGTAFGEKVLGYGGHGDVVVMESTGG
jgi:hypothetical protein